MITTHHHIDNINKYILTDIQYFGTVNWYKMLYKFTNIQIEQYETYQKMSFRNRCMIAGSNGVMNLSVPLEKGRSQKLLLKDVKISYAENWQEQQWRSINSCYGSAPFFEFYVESLQILFTTKPVYLIDLNWQTIEWVLKRLKSVAVLSKTLAYDPAPFLPTVDIRNLYKIKNYDQQDNNLRYQQVFEDRIGFKPNLCILDFLFCNGPASKSILLED
jgi:hypothetical protein